MSDDRDRLPPPPVDALPDLAWARVERAVLAELDVPPARAVHVARRRWLVPALAGAAMATAAAATIVLLPSADPVAPRAAAPGLPTRVVTGVHASELSYGDARVSVAPASAIVLAGSAERGVLAVLERGGAAFSVAPRRARPPFMVQAGAVTVGVVGTEFTVTRVGAEDAVIAVRDGVVEVTCRGERGEVTAGQRWSCIPAAAAIAGDAGAAGAAPTDDASDDQARFEAAARLETRDPAAALAGYRELSRGRGAWASNALYALGRLAFDRGEHDAARAALADYLVRFPRGANAADARALLARQPKGASR